MNIYVVSEYGKFFHLRPDSSLVKGSSDFYVPEYINSISACSGVLFFLEKSARFIEEPFFDRYVKFYSFDVLLYAEFRDESFFNNNSGLFSLIFDKSTYLSSEKISTDIVIEGNLTLSADETEYKTRLDSFDYIEIAKKTLNKLSSICTLKTGDIIFIEHDHVKLDNTVNRLELFHNITHHLRLNIK